MGCCRCEPQATLEMNNSRPFYCRMIEVYPCLYPGRASTIVHAIQGVERLRERKGEKPLSGGQIRRQQKTLWASGICFLFLLPTQTSIALVLPLEVPYEVFLFFF